MHQSTGQRQRSGQHQYSLYTRIWECPKVGAPLPLCTPNRADLGVIWNSREKIPREPNLNVTKPQGSVPASAPLWDNRPDKLRWQHAGQDSGGMLGRVGKPSYTQWAEGQPKGSMEYQPTRIPLVIPGMGSISRQVSSPTPMRTPQRHLHNSKRPALQPSPHLLVLAVGNRPRRRESKKSIYLCVSSRQALWQLPSP